MLCHALVQQMHEAVIVVDRAGIVRLWNPGAEALFGYPASHMLNGTLEPIIPERFRQAHNRGFERAIHSGDTRYHGQVMTTRAVHRDGSRLYVDLSFVLLRNGQGEVFGVCAVGRPGQKPQPAAEPA